ncbi:MAG: (2Fe-2S)-binding protein [Pirellulales bacterium]|nr:(2Fe-2S)-binding protein [Pirellulales bacterium]
MDATNHSSAKDESHPSVNADGVKTGSGPRRIEGNRGMRVDFTFDGKSIEAFEGETIAAALLASGVRTLRQTERKGEPRGLFCNMGICFECLVEVNGNPNQRACQYQVTDGLEIKSQPADSLERYE